MHVITYRPHVIMANLQPILSGHNYMQLHTRETRDDRPGVNIQGDHLHKVTQVDILQDAVQHMKQT